LQVEGEREAKTMASHPDYFFVDSSGNQYGPVAAEVIKQYWNGGYVNEETFCFAADGRLATWTPLKDVKALYELCVPPRVPQAPSLVARPVLAAPVLHVAEVAKQLEMCVAVLHHEALKLALASVGSKGEEHFASYGELLQAARALDANLDAVRAELKAGISCSDLKQLERAIERSRHLGLSHYELPAAVHHAHRMRALIKMARLALTTLEDAPLAAVVAEADQLHFVCDEERFHERNVHPQQKVGVGRSIGTRLVVPRVVGAGDAIVKSVDAAGFVVDRLVASERRDGEPPNGSRQTAQGVLFIARMVGYSREGTGVKSLHEKRADSSDERAEVPMNDPRSIGRNIQSAVVTPRDDVEPRRLAVRRPRQQSTETHRHPFLHRVVRSHSAISLWVQS
jgi:hypothetical protein